MNNNNEYLIFILSQSITITKTRLPFSVDPQLQCIFLCKNFQTKRVNNIEPILQNGNGTLDNRHTSVRRLLSERTKDELNLSHVVVP